MQTKFIAYIIHEDNSPYRGCVPIKQLKVGNFIKLLQKLVMLNGYVVIRSQGDSQETSQQRELSTSIRINKNNVDVPLLLLLPSKASENVLVDQLSQLGELSRPFKSLSKNEFNQLNHEESHEIIWALERFFVAKRTIQYASQYGPMTNK